MNGNGYSRIALIAALVAIALFATMAVLFVTTSDESLQRLALLFGLFGVAVPSIIGVLKADTAAAQTEKMTGVAKALNGVFEDRVQAAAMRANEATAAGVPPPPPMVIPELEDDPPIDKPPA